MRKDGMAHDRAAHRDTLALAAREGAGLAVEQLTDAEQLRRVLDATPPLGLGDALHPEREPDVVANGHVRAERVVLEDHRDVTIDRIEVVDDLVANRISPSVGVLETRHHARAVVFPQPDGPTKIMNSPSPISRSRSSTATVPSPNRFVTGT